MRFLYELRKTARHDLGSLTQAGIGALLLLLVLPASLLLIAPDGASSQPVRIAVAGSATNARATERLVTVLDESSRLRVSREPQAVADPLAYLQERDIEILLNYEGDSRQPSMYTAETEPRRLELLERIGAGIVRAEVVIAHRLAGKTSSEPLFASVWWARPALYEDLFMLGTLPVNPLAEYYPQAADPRAATLPSLVLLTIGLLPFALALALSRSPIPPNPATGEPFEAVHRIPGRAIVPAAVALLQVLVLLLVAEVTLGVHIKAGVIRIAALLFLAAASSALIGIAVAAWCRTSIALAIACLCYGLPAALFTQVPYAQLSPIAWLFPSTYVMPVLNGWLFGAPYDTAAVTRAMSVVGVAGIAWAVTAWPALRGNILEKEKDTIVVPISS
jgi:hypothetical protein